MFFKSIVFLIFGCLSCLPVMRSLACWRSWKTARRNVGETILLYHALCLVVLYSKIYILCRLNDYIYIYICTVYIYIYNMLQLVFAHTHSYQTKPNMNWICSVSKVNHYWNPASGFWWMQNSRRRSPKVASKPSTSGAHCMKNIYTAHRILDVITGMTISIYYNHLYFHIRLH